jgi:hypothetical protein
MKEKYRLDALNLNKVFRDASHSGKADMIYKIYWNPRKWVKPLTKEEGLKPPTAITTKQIA